VFARSRTLIRIGEVPIQVDPTWFLIIVLLAWSFWSRFTTVPPTHPAGVALAMAVTATALFALSVLAHELAHALEAKRRGVPVGGITLYLFGGATETASEARRPGDEFAVTAVGPWTSLVLGCGFGLTAFGAGQANLAAAGQVAALLAWSNLALAFFNLLPGAPLDGGRILDSIVWRVTGDHDRARRVATSAGRLLGYALVVLGFFEAVAVSGGFIGGLWLAFIGWFLAQAAAAEARAPRRTPSDEPGRGTGADPASETGAGPARETGADPASETGAGPASETGAEWGGPEP